MSDQTTPVIPTARVKVFDAVVSAKPATPEQIRAEQEALKLKEQSNGPGNRSPL